MGHFCLKIILCLAILFALNLVTKTPVYASCSPAECTTANVATTCGSGFVCTLSCCVAISNPPTPTCSDTGLCGTYPDCYSCPCPNGICPRCSDTDQCGEYPNCRPCTCSSIGQCGYSPNCTPCPTGTCACGGTYPNCTACTSPPSSSPPAAYGYGCSGLGCVWMSGGGFGNDATCGNYSCLGAQPCNLSANISPQPVDTGQGVSFQFTEGPGAGNANRGYVDVSFDPNSGAGGCSGVIVDGGCNNNNGQSCSWTYNCTSTSSTSVEYQTFNAYFHAFTAVPYNHAADCSITVPYIVHSAPTPYYRLVSPANGATLTTLNPTLNWTTNNPYIGNNGYTNALICSNSNCSTIVGACGGGPNGTNCTYVGNALAYSTQYWWEVYGYNNSTYWATSPIWTFTTPPSLPSCTVTSAPTSLSLTPGNTSQIGAAVTVTNGSSSNIQSISWTSSAPSVATVTTPGNPTTVTGVTNGTSNITTLVTLTPGGNTCNNNSVPTAVSVATPYFQTFGGNVTAKGKVTDIFLPAGKYISTQ